MTPFKVGDLVPDVWVQTRVDDEFVGWNTNESMQGKKVILFALPGAFTPTCSSTHLPGYEIEYDNLLANGVDEVYCLSVNDTFVMNSWMAHQDISKVKP